MTDKHPLTDEMCETLSRHGLLGCDDDPEGLIYDMRAAYDKGAADKLEQVVKWLRQHLTMEVASVNLKERDLLLEDLKKAMRPQQQQENN